jgi:glycosyltransferase involved in cell wall biosynthesis
MQVKVSICIPAYNQTEFLRKNLQSILEQSYSDLEVIVSDDSTTGEVEKLVKELFSGKQINYTYHKNPTPLGSPANWNKAISLARGEYIKILHHDDWFSRPDSLGTFVKALDDNAGCDFAFCSSKILNVATGNYTENRPAEDFLETLRKDELVLFDYNKIGAPSATIYRKSLNLDFDTKMKFLVDVDFYIRVLRRNHNFVFIEDALIVNTSNNASQVTAASMNKKTQIGEYSYLYNKLFNGKIPDKKYRKMFRLLFAHYKMEAFDEIEQMGCEKPRPAWFFKGLFLLAKYRGS